MSYSLFLDDIRLPYWIYDNTYDWVVVKSKDEFIELITFHGTPARISFDNDLGTTSSGEIAEDGYACLNWLIDNDIIVEHIIVHSDNVVANEQISGKASNWYKHLIKQNIIPDNTSFKVTKRPALKNLREEYFKK